jgi:hypothetical protein
MKPIISEELVHTAVDYLAYHGDKAAKAKGMQVRAEYHRRRVKARLILSAPHTSHGMREAWAEAHDEYRVAWRNLAKADEEVEKHRNQRSKSETICEMWRTEQATIRGLRRVA